MELYHEHDGNDPSSPDLEDMLKKAKQLASFMRSGLQDMTQSVEHVQHDNESISQCDALLQRMLHFRDVFHLTDLEPDRAIYNAVLNALAKSRQASAVEKAIFSTFSLIFGGEFRKPINIESTSFNSPFSKYNSIKVSSFPAMVSISS